MSSLSELLLRRVASAEFSPAVSTPGPIRNSFVPSRVVTVEIALFKRRYATRTVPRLIPALKGRAKL
ncbi:MAG TPA: hypothetical protein DC047_10960 [Blastocatellia bacterium]|nr:hypothetical protein [Blastocatellia bacterium]